LLSAAQLLLRLGLLKAQLLYRPQLVLRRADDRLARADFALVNAKNADYHGNLSYALTARNFNPVIAMAADRVLVRAENIVPVGVIPPDEVMTPAPVVDYLIAH
jgi:acyl CoA:acetate/3-ketoacid CoA transferase alpha subunit